jgi:RND family efflux transporter MFP subunit
MPHRRNLWTLLLVAVGLFGCGSHGKKVAADGAAESTLPTREVHLARAEEGRLARTVEVPGTLAAQDQAQLATKVAGRVESVLVDIGSRVTAGQPITRLAPTDFQLRVEQAQAALVQARVRLSLSPEGPDRTVAPEETAGVKQAAANLKAAQLTRNRTSRLFDQQLVARSDLDTADANLAVAEGRYQDAIEEAGNRQGMLAQRRSELDIARQALADSTVVAPFDGAISARLVSRGDYVAAGAPVAALVRIHPLRLRMNVPERESAGIRVGQTVKVQVEGDEREHGGRIARVSPALREEDRTLAVEAEVPNPDGQLRPGSFVRARIVIAAGQPAVLVPSSSIVTFAGLEKVIGVEAGKAVEKRVRTGQRLGEQVEIVDGVKAGDAVVVQPGNLVSGQPVKILP